MSKMSKISKIYQNSYKIRNVKSNEINEYKFQVSNLLSNKMNDLIKRVQIGNENLKNNESFKKYKTLDLFSHQAKHFTLSMDDNLIMYGRLIPNINKSQLNSISNGKIKYPKEVDITKTAEISNYYIDPLYKNSNNNSKLDAAMVYFQSKYSLENNINTLVTSINTEPLNDYNNATTITTNKMELFGFKKFGKQYSVFSNRISGINYNSKFNFVNLQPIYKKLNNTTNFDSLIKLTLHGELPLVKKSINNIKLK